MTPDRWLKLTVRLTGPESGPATWRAPAPGSWPALAGSSDSDAPFDPLRELIPDFLLEMGGRGVEESSEGFTTYLTPPDDLDSLLSLARTRLAGLAPEGVELSWGWQPHEDWESLWRQGLGPRRITPRIVVAPTWDRPQPRPGEILITLDPGMAFGTAEHATTRGCLRLLDGRVWAGDRWADIGSGSGILSIAAALLGAKHVLAVEVDPMAWDTARENLLANGVQDRVRILVEEARGGSPLPEAPYEGIVANIQRFILVPLLPAFRSSLGAHGRLILSGILLEEREALLEATTLNGFTLEEEDQEGEWWSGAFTLGQAPHPTCAEAP